MDELEALPTAGSDIFSSSMMTGLERSVAELEMDGVRGAMLDVIVSSHEAFDQYETTDMPGRRRERYRELSKIGGNEEAIYSDTRKLESKGVTSAMSQTSHQNS